MKFLKTDTKALLNYLFNWKDNPASVFWLAIPLFLSSYGLITYAAYLQWDLNGDPWYMVIALAGLALLAFGIWPVRKLLFKLLK